MLDIEKIAEDVMSFPGCRVAVYCEGARLFDTAMEIHKALVERGADGFNVYRLSANTGINLSYNGENEVFVRDFFKQETFAGYGVHISYIKSVRKTNSPNPTGTLLSEEKLQETLDLIDARMTQVWPEAPDGVDKKPMFEGHEMQPGDRFVNSADGQEYILSKVADGFFALIGLTSGNRYYKPSAMVDVFHDREEEFSLLVKPRVTEGGVS